MSLNLESLREENEVKYCIFIIIRLWFKLWWTIVVSSAEETCLLFTDKSWDGVHKKVTVRLNVVYQCLCDRNLTFNEEKTMFMTYSICKSSSNLNPITIYRYVDGNSCNNENKCIVIKKATIELDI